MEAEGEELYLRSSAVACEQNTFVQQKVMEITKSQMQRKADELCT